MSDPFLNTKPAWSDTAHLALLDSFYPSAHSLTEAQEQILRLKLELVDKERELELYLHVAARATEDAKETSRTTSENHELRDALHVARMRERTLQLMPPPGYAMPGPPAPSQALTRQTPLQGTLAEINFAFDLLDAKGDGVIGRWELLRGMMDTPEVRGLLRLSTVANQAEFDTLTKSMGGTEADSVSRHEFECFFLMRELERSGMIAGGGGGGGGGGAVEGKGAAKGAAKEGDARGAKGGADADTKGKAKGKEGGSAGDTTTAVVRGSDTRMAGRPTPMFTNPSGYVVPGYTPGVTHGPPLPAYPPSPYMGRYGVPPPDYGGGYGYGGYGGYGQQYHGYGAPGYHPATPGAAARLYDPYAKVM